MEKPIGQLLKLQEFPAPSPYGTKGIRRKRNEQIYYRKTIIGEYVPYIKNKKGEITLITDIHLQQDKFYCRQTKQHIATGTLELRQKILGGN